MKEWQNHFRLSTIVNFLPNRERNPTAAQFPTKFGEEKQRENAAV